MHHFRIMQQTEGTAKDGLRASPMIQPIAAQISNVEMNRDEHAPDMAGMVEMVE